jgi:RNA polymerase sigma-70 factor (ECF subfamily)
MDERDFLARRFEDHRTHLRAVAYRMLGSASEADDAVQEAWLRVSRSGAQDVENLGGWLTTIVARVSLNMLRSRRTRREESLDGRPVEPAATGTDPEHQALLVDSVGLALLVVLDTLTPAERLAFVLHDLFAMPFDEIAPIVDRTPAAARQLASRARRRVQAAGPAVPEADPGRQREVVEAFLAAARGGRFDALLELLDPDVVLRADAAAVRVGAPAELRGAPAVAGTFRGRIRHARLAVIDGAAGAVFAPGGQLKVVFGFTVTNGRIIAVEMIADPDLLPQLDVTVLHG